MQGTQCTIYRWSLRDKPKPKSKPEPDLGPVQVSIRALDARGFTLVVVRTDGSESEGARPY